VNEGGSPPYGCCRVNGLCHLSWIGAFFKARLRKRIDAIGALYSVCCGKTNERLLSLDELAFGKYRFVVIKGLLSQNRYLLPLFPQISLSLLAYSKCP
jgi:hypothetical protein